MTAPVISYGIESRSHSHGTPHYEQNPSDDGANKTPIVRWWRHGGGGARVRALRNKIDKHSVPTHVC